MKLFKMPSILILTVAMLAYASPVNGQPPLLVEDFNYPAGSLITANGWTAHSAGGTNAIAAVAPGLTYAGYPSSGIGNSAGMTVSGEDANRTFAVQTSGSVFAAFMVNLSDVSTDAVGGYFFHLGPDPIGTAFRGRVFARKDGSNNVSFGLSKTSTSGAEIAYTGFTYSLNTTYLFVLKYTIVDGAGNDTVQLYINPTLPGSEPGTATLTATDVTAPDINPGTAALRQGTASTSPTLLVDGIRVGTSWASVTTGTTAPTQNIVDFNGDGRTDFAVVRNLTELPGGQMRWFINYNGTTTIDGFDWGLQGDIPLPVDFDGDGKSDIAVWRSVSSGQPVGNAFFYIFESATSTVRIEDFGQIDDNPNVVGDYDGDGKADVAVYRRGTNPGDQSTWFYRGSLNNPNGNITFVQWGVNGDFPAPGDYDGDGRNDFVIQRDNGNSQARFWMQQTTDGFETVVFGRPRDFIVPGDYDGDGKTDIAVVRRDLLEQIEWYVRPSSTGVVSAAPTAIFGDNISDLPAQGDYDGDGRTDIAIWRSGTIPGQSGFWYLGSTSGLAVVPFGLSTDIPVARYNTH